MPLRLGGKDFSLYAVLDVLRRRMPYILVPFLIAAAASVLFVMLIPVRYRAQALLSTRAPLTQAYIDNGSTPPKVQDQLVTIREALYGPDVLERTIKELGLGVAPGQAPSPQAVEEIKPRVRVTVDGDETFYIGFEGPDRAQVTSVANRLAELFTQRLSNVGQRRAEDTSGFLDSEVARLRAKLNTQEERLKRYKQGALSELPDNRDMNLRAMETARMQAQSVSDHMAADQARLVAVKDEMKELEQQGVLKPQAPTQKDKSPEEAKLDDLRLQLKQAQAKYTERHPEMTRLKKEILDLEALLASQPSVRPTPEPSVARMHYLQLKGERESLERRLQSYPLEIADLNRQEQLYSRRLNSAPLHETALTDLMRDYENTRNQYNALLEKQQQANLTGRLRKTNGATFTIVEPASLPKAPLGPSRPLLLAAGLFASFGLGLGLAFVREQLDTTFDSIDEFQAFTNVPVLTTIPTISADPKSAVAPPKSRRVEACPPSNGRGPVPPQTLPLAELHKSRLIALSDPKSVAAEQYRILALKARQQLGEAACPALLMTSSIGGEGKTLTTLNLSFALSASQEERILLIESDLRKPRMHEYLGLPPSLGFSDLLLRPDDDLSKYTWRVGDLHLISGGSSLANPVELLASQRARSLFTRLREEFDFIVVDAPPTLPIVDTHILAGLVDGVLLVVRARYTRRELFQRAIESFQAANIVGVVLNDIDYQRSPYAYAYQYYSKNYLAVK